MLLNMWQFDTSPDWEILGNNFDSVSLNSISDNTLQALDFHFFLLGYLEEGVLRFVNITNNLDLTIELVNNGQSITYFKYE